MNRLKNRLTFVLERLILRGRLSRLDPGDEIALGLRLEADNGVAQARYVLNSDR